MDKDVLYAWTILEEHWGDSQAQQIETVDGGVNDTAYQNDPAVSDPADDSARKRKAGARVCRGRSGDTWNRSGRAIYRRHSMKAQSIVRGERELIREIFMRILRDRLRRLLARLPRKKR
jgi:hypothetical protein